MSEKERQSHLDATFRDIATIVAEKCVNPDSKRPYPVGVIERAMKEVHYSVKPSKGSKQQALEVIRLLKENIPIERARMRLQVQLPAKEAQHLREKLLSVVIVEGEDWVGGHMEMVNHGMKDCAFCSQRSATIAIVTFVSGHVNCLYIVGRCVS